MTDDPETLYCANHPQVPTSLRCNRCEKPICIKCARLTPTGYRCRECVSGQQKSYETAQWADFPLAIGAAVVIAGLGSLLSLVMGFLTIFIAPIFGMAIAEAVRWVARKRRSRLLSRAVTIAAAVGSLPVVVYKMLGLLMAFQSGLGAFYGAGTLLGLLWPGVYMVIITSSVYYRISGINLNT